MKTRIFLGTALVLLTCAAHADNESPKYYETHPYKIGKIATVSVTEPSRNSGVNAQESCESFVMTPKLVKEFFTHAKVLTQNDYHYQSDISSCDSKGKITFTNGDRGEWIISRNGVGLMSVWNSKAQDEVIYLHCAKCEDWNL